jgi:hypothetical protein
MATIQGGTFGAGSMRTAPWTGPRSSILKNGTSVRQRWNRSAKDGFWEDLEKQRRVYQHCLLAGDVDPLRRLRLTRQLLADIESLLIRRISPWGNIQCQRTRIIRPGLRVRCLGEWPLERLGAARQPVPRARRKTCRRD